MLQAFKDEVSKASLKKYARHSATFTFCKWQNTSGILTTNKTIIVT